MSKPSTRLSRRRLLKYAIRVELLGIIWIVTETVMSAVAAIQQGGLAMSTFSVDSAIELLSAIVLCSRLYIEFNTGDDAISKVVERLSSAVVGVCLFALAAFISWKSGEAFAVGKAVQTNNLGLITAVLSSLITPWLATRKRRLGHDLESHALLGDAACSMTCAYMAWTLLAGLVLERFFGWWWVDAVSALGILYFVLQEAWEAVIAAWTGETHVHDH